MNYALIKNGVVENVIVADQEFIDSIAHEWDHIEALDTPEEQKVASPGWLWDDKTNTFSQPADSVQAIELPPTPKVTKLSKLAFRNRFTPAEKIAIELGQLDDPTKTMNERAAAAAIRVMQLDLQAAEYIDLSETSLIEGVQLLEQFGLIGVGRAAEILSQL